MDPSSKVGSVPGIDAAPLARGMLRALPLVLVVLLGASVVRSPQRIHHDCAIYVQCGELLLDGKVPYVDFVDINPPLIMYLNAVPAFVARRLGIAPIVTFSLFVVVVVAVSTAALQSQLADGWSIERGDAAVLASLWAAFSFGMWHVGQFGQREHLLVLLYIPLLVARCRRTVGVQIPRWRAVLLGVAGGVGVCVKPHFMVVVLLIELRLLLATREIRRFATAELAGFASVPVAYALHFLFVPAAMRDSFFYRWVPLVARNYSVYSSAFPDIITAVIVIAALVSLVALAARGLWAGSIRVLADALSVFVLGSVAVYAFQAKGWFYHQVAAVGGTVLLLGMVVAARCAPVKPGRAVALSVRALGAMVLGMLWLVVVVGGYAEPDSGLFVSRFGPLIDRYSRKGEPVLFVSTHVTPAYPTLVQKERRPGSRYLWFFPIPMLRHQAAAPGSRADALSSEERRLLRELAEDIAVRRPPLVFVSAENGCPGCAPDFNVLGYLEQAGFVEASLRDYARVGEAFGFVQFVLKERTEGGKVSLALQLRRVLA